MSSEKVSRSLKASFPALDAILSDSAGVDAAILDRLAADHPPKAALLLHLLELAESAEPTVQIAATALLKRYLESGATLNAEVVVRLLDLLPNAPHWKMSLHLLQMLEYLPLPRSHAESVCECLLDLLPDRNKFLRAWTYSGLHRLAALYPDYRAEVSPLLKRAAQEESASVRARIRRLPSLSKVRSNVSSSALH